MVMLEQGFRNQDGRMPALVALAAGGIRMEARDAKLLPRFCRYDSGITPRSTEVEGKVLAFWATQHSRNFTKRIVASPLAVQKPGLKPTFWDTQHSLGSCWEGGISPQQHRSWG